MCFLKRTMHLYVKRVCVTEKINARKTNNKKKKIDGETESGSLRCNSALGVCALPNSFLKCLLNHLDLSVPWKSKASWLIFSDNSISPNRRWSR